MVFNSPILASWLGLAWLGVDCLSMSRWMISWLTLPAVERTKLRLRVHREGSLRKGGNSSRRRCGPRPLLRRGMSAGSVFGLARMNKVPVVRLERPSDDLPTRSRRSRYLPDKLLQAVPHSAYQHLAPPFGAPDDEVHHQVDVVPVVRIRQVSYPFFYNACKSERLFIPRLKTGAF